MVTNFHRLCKAASVAALTVGVVFAQQPVQKASAQTLPGATIVGAGSSSVTSIFDDNNPLVNTAIGYDSEVWNYTNSFGVPYRYIVAGSGVGRAAFRSGTVTYATNSGNQTVAVDFASTDGIGTTFGANTVVRNNTIVNTVTNAPVIDPITGQRYIVVNGVTTNLVFAYNVKFANGTNFDASINGETACRIIRGNASLGDPINWNQVRNSSNQLGPDLPIRRVVRGDVSGQTVTLNGPSGVPTIYTDSTLTTRGTYGLVQACNNGFRLFPGQPVTPPLATFTSNPIPSIIGPGVNGLNDGTAIPNPKTVDIIVPAATRPTNPNIANPFGAAVATGNDNNTNSYSLGIITAVRNNNGAISYTEAALVDRAIDENGSFPAAQRISVIGGTVIAAGPHYAIFRADYRNANGTQNLNKVLAATDVCYGYIFSAFLGNRVDQIYPRQAGFDIDASTFPFNRANSTQQGTDTDNYGSLGQSNPLDFGPCSRIGGFIGF